MKRIVARTGMTLLALFSVGAFAQTELQTYVQRCQNEVQFSAADVPNLNCNDGVGFDTGGKSPINDFLVYHRVNDNVDLMAACRWGDDFVPPFKEHESFVSLEMMITNRANGATCFFAAREQESLSGRVSTAIVSPTNFPAANNYWLSPTELNDKVVPSDHNLDGGFVHTDPIRCVGCHAGGAVIASQRIAPYLARFGLINNRRDTLADFSRPNSFRVVGSNHHLDPNSGNHPFKAWNSIIYQNNQYSGTCSASCHTLASHSQIGSLTIPDNFGFEVLPSIQRDIAQLIGSRGMPPNAEDSPYRWINLDTPGNGIETESFADAKASNTPPPTPQLLNSCAAPGELEGRAVGVPDYSWFSTTRLASIPNRLRTFNAKEGLVCLNSDQDPGNSCRDYQTSYLCGDEWTFPENRDSPNTGDGDREPRAGATACANPLAIKAVYNDGTGNVEVIGPTDRLWRISPYGISCRNSDQPDGRCSNYVVRYRNCTSAPTSRQAHLVNVYGGRQLTATGGANNAPAKAQPYTPSWNTQNWEIIPVPNTEYVRLRNTGTNTYLNVSTTDEAAEVGTHALNTGYDSQVFVIEPIPGSNDVRIRNLWSGKYLTAYDASNYSPIYSQSLNPAWPTQRWVIQ